MSQKDPAARFNDHLNPQKVVPELYTKYDWAEFTVATATTNYDVLANEAAMFLNVSKANKVIIECDQDVTVRFNSTSNPAINHRAFNSPWEWKDIFEITNIYITNVSGNTANIKILLV